MSVGMTGEQIQHAIDEAERFVRGNPYPYYAQAWEKWAEDCTPEARAVFLAIRANTPGRWATGEHDPSKPTLASLSEDLRQLLDVACWNLWQHPSG